MFIHLVLFKIKAENVSVYTKDCKLWEREAKHQKGFLGYKTLFRTNARGHYASFYMWKVEKDHTRFMNKHHDRLVFLSRCPVEVLGYYNFSTSPLPEKKH